MRKFEISETMSNALEKQDSTLMLTTAVSAVGWIFVKGIQLVTEAQSDELTLEVEADFEADVPEDK